MSESMRKNPFSHHTYLVTIELFKKPAPLCKTDRKRNTQRVCPPLTGIGGWISPPPNADHKGLRRELSRTIGATLFKKPCCYIVFII